MPQCPAGAMGAAWARLETEAAEFNPPAGKMPTRALGKTGVAVGIMALGLLQTDYALSLPIHTATSGVSSYAQLRQNLEACYNFKPMEDRERQAFRATSKSVL